MPGGDRTGPRGFGPMTGRRAGYCAGYDRPGFDTPGFDTPHPGYGERYGGRGGGHGWRHWYHATGVPGWRRGGYEPAPEGELAVLKNESEWLKSRIEAIDRRIEELERKE
jgi:hypothetical protein